VAAQVWQGAQEGPQNDWASWLDVKAKKFARDAEEGKMETLWKVCKLAKTPKAAKRRILQVLQNLDGTVPQTEEEIADFWTSKFVEEFGGRARTMHRSDYDQQLSEMLDGRTNRGNQTPVDWTEDQWVEAAAEAICRQPTNKATGPDAVPSELMKAGGLPYATHLGSLMRKVATAGTIPTEWRGSRMVTVKKKPALPMSRKNSRGVALESHQGKAYGKILRNQVAPQLTLAAFGTQFGGIPGKSVEFASHIVHLFAQRGKHKGRATVELFIDLVAAFYRVLSEEALGPMTTTERQRNLLQRMNWEEADILQFEEHLSTKGATSCSSEQTRGGRASSPTGTP